MFSIASYADDVVSSHLDVFEVQLDANGHEMVVPAGVVHPGELLEYQIVYRNSGAGPLRNLDVKDAVPSGTSYVADSAAADPRHQMLFSVDGGTHWLAPPIPEAAPDRYTNIEWRSLDALEPNKPQKFTYRVRVNSAAAPAASVTVTKQ